MAYTKVTDSDGLSELAGQIKLFFVKVSPDAATGSYVFSDATKILSVSAIFAEDSTATCTLIQAAVDGSTVNQVNFKLWKADGATAADTAYHDFYVIAIGTSA